MSSPVPQIIDFAAVIEPYLDKETDNSLAKDDTEKDNVSDDNDNDNDHDNNNNVGLDNGNGSIGVGSRVVTYTSTFLTKPGDNYGSVMLSILALIRRRCRSDSATATIEELTLVAKLPPILNDMYWDIFQPERTCRTENSIYALIAPALRRLQLDRGLPENQLIDCFTRYYGSRISLDSAAERVDRNALLVLENLQTSGYRVGNRHVPYDRMHTCLILKQLAAFHALPIALRLLRPDVFEEVVRPHTRRFSMNAGMSPEVKAEFDQDGQKEVELATNNNAALVQQTRQLKERYDRHIEGPDDADTPYTTVAHSDLWINNIMIQYDGDGQPHRLKFVDFQLAQYQSLAHDLVFFLLSSVETNLVETEFESLLRVYHEAFVGCMVEVGVPTHNYTFTRLMEEVLNIAPLEVSHALFMVKVVLAGDNTLPADFKDVGLHIFSSNSGRQCILQKISDILRISQKFKFIS